MEAETKTPPKSVVSPTKPVLLFQDPTNLDLGKALNTFRVGKKDLKEEDVVTLVRAENNTPIGEAVVSQVIVGKWEEVKAFAPDNHLYWGRPTLEAQEGLLSALKSFYPDFKPEKDQITVLYLRRTK